MVDIISRRALVVFSLLCPRNYYGRKGTVCYVLTVYIQSSYGELSIVFLFNLLLDKPACVHLMLWYFNLQQILYLYHVLFVIITEL